MLTPKQFAEKVGLSYAQALYMCKNGEIEAIKTRKGYYKIPEKELDKFAKRDDYVTKEKYEEVIRENERLKTEIGRLKTFVDDIAV